MYANTYSVRVVTGLWLGVHAHVLNKKGTLNQLIQTLQDKIYHKMHVNTQNLTKTYMYTIFQSYNNLINFSQTLSLSLTSSASSMLPRLTYMLATLKYILDPGSGMSMKDFIASEWRPFSASSTPFFQNSMVSLRDMSSERWPG